MDPDSIKLEEMNSQQYQSPRVVSFSNTNTASNKDEQKMQGLKSEPQ